MKKYLFLFFILTASVGLVLSCSKPNNNEDDNGNNEDKITLSRVVGRWEGTGSNSCFKLTINSDKTVSLYGTGMTFSFDNYKNKYEAIWTGTIKEEPYSFFKDNRQTLIIHFTSIDVIDAPGTTHSIDDNQTVWDPKYDRALYTLENGDMILHTLSYQPFYNQAGEMYYSYLNEPWRKVN